MVQLENFEETKFDCRLLPEQGQHELCSSLLYSIESNY